jgi:hypothetical protein
MKKKFILARIGSRDVRVTAQPCVALAVLQPDREEID